MSTQRLMWAPIMVLDTVGCILFWPNIHVFTDHITYPTNSFPICCRNPSMWDDFIMFHPFHPHIFCLHIHAYPSFSSGQTEEWQVSCSKRHGWCPIHRSFRRDFAAWTGSWVAGIWSTGTHDQSLGTRVNKGNHLQMAASFSLIQFSEVKYDNFPRSRGYTLISLIVRI